MRGVSVTRPRAYSPNDRICPVCAPLAHLTPDLREYVVRLAAEIVHEKPPFEGLQATQSRIVRLIRARRGRTISAGAIAEALGWETGEPSTERCVVVQICKIRKARPDLGAHIETVFGAGYRWKKEPS